jgi:hypothetical protein
MSSNPSSTQKIITGFKEIKERGCLANTRRINLGVVVHAYNPSTRGTVKKNMGLRSAQAT